MAALAAGLTGALRGTLRLPDAEACRPHARSRFDIPVIAARTAQIYREAVNRCE
ncbi:hypothetical protein WME79_34410 [Sorangium sp. So ce726]|uniref:hypothetical protein n=1 Tax=Sorangium sp. So ce726 TaxID=3133319 RepID=UPI003F63BA36